MDEERPVKTAETQFALQCTRSIDRRHAVKTGLGVVSVLAVPIAAISLTARPIPSRPTRRSSEDERNREAATGVPGNGRDQPNWGAGRGAGAATPEASRVSRSRRKTTLRARQSRASGDRTPEP